jgi:hypothetical protein
MRGVSRVSTAAIASTAAVLVIGGTLAALVATSSSAAGRPTVAIAPARTAARPGALQKTARVHGYELALGLSPNSASSVNTVSVRLLRHGRAVSSARVRLTTQMTTMSMGYTGLLTPKRAGRYTHAWPPLEMRGAWWLRVEVTPAAGGRFAVAFLDHVS